MKPIRVTATVDRPREELFDWLSDLREHEQFTDHFLTDYSGTATRVRARAKLPGPAQWAEIEAIEATAPERLVERAVGAGGRRETQGVYRLAPAPGGGTAVMFELAYLRTPLAERVLAPVLRGWLRRQNQRAMDRLKAAAEARAAVAA